MDIETGRTYGVKIRKAERENTRHRLMRAFCFLPFAASLPPCRVRDLRIDLNKAYQGREIFLSSNDAKHFAISSLRHTGSTFSMVFFKDSPVFRPNFLMIRLISYLLVLIANLYMVAPFFGRKTAIFEKIINEAQNALPNHSTDCFMRRKRRERQTTCG